MRKIIWLVLAVGAAELLKREANKRATTIPNLLSNVRRIISNRQNGAEADQKA